LVDALYIPFELVSFALELYDFQRQITLAMCLYDIRGIFGATLQYRLHMGKLGCRCCGIAVLNLGPLDLIGVLLIRYLLRRRLSLSKRDEL